MKANDLTVGDILRIAGLEGKVSRRVDSYNFFGKREFIFCYKDERGKQCRVTVNPSNGDIEILTIEDL